MVAGTRTPEPIERMRDLFPDAYDELEHAVDELERHYRDVQDVEFTVEHDRLYLLQTRGAKRTAAAALRAAVAFVDEGLISPQEAVRRIDPAAVEQLLHPAIDPTTPLDVAAVGLAASPGAACGVVVFDADDVAAAAEQGDVILVRPETTADDIHGLIGAAGVLTARGGMTSHAAVVARGMGKPCVAGCAALHVDVESRTAELGGHMLARRRRDHDRRHDGQGRARRGSARRSRAERRLRPRPSVGRRGASPRRARQRGHAGGRSARAGERRRGDRPLPHRAHVHGGRPAAGRPAR